MGFTRGRTGADGRARYTAYYVDEGRRERSAGTFASRRDADRAWQQVEAALAAGRPGPQRGKITFRSYVDDVWFPHHVLEPSTRQSYRYNLDRHILPTFGAMRMSTIMPFPVRQWVTELAAAGVSPATIRHTKIVLSAVFTTALNDFVVGIHPCRGVKTPPVPVKEYRIPTPAEYARLHTALPNAPAQLLAETAVESGARWGELAELRLRDLHEASGIVTISRSVAEVQPRFSPTGERFVIKPYPKGRGPAASACARRRPQRSRPSLRKPARRRTTCCSHSRTWRSATRPRLVSVDALGYTEPTEAGRRYRHGTLSAYTAGRCRCTHCRSAMARYRADRRERGLDAPRGVRARDTSGHIPRDRFRTQVWLPACAAAGIDPPIRLHDLRHSHASWLLAGGADLQVVKERLGHRSIATTEKYLHTLPDADDTALAALDRIHARRPCRREAPGVVTHRHSGCWIRRHTTAQRDGPPVRCKCVRGCSWFEVATSAVSRSVTWQCSAGLGAGCHTGGQGCDRGLA